MTYVMYDRGAQGIFNTENRETGTSFYNTKSMNVHEYGRGAPVLYIEIAATPRRRGKTVASRL